MDDEKIHELMNAFDIAKEFGFLDSIVQHWLEMGTKDIKIMTKVAVALNWQCWKYAETNEKLARWYEKKWKEADAYVIEGEEKGDDYIYKNYTKDEVSYYLKETD